MQGPSTHQKDLSQANAQAAAGKSKNDEKAEEMREEKSTDAVDDITELKESLQALKEVKTLIQEFSTLLETARLCRKATIKKEKVLIVLNALLSD
ncbi:hypothetical protein AVEN_169751-1 [Araneus ventricosus]|uniref:Uncharacterized protein n=1 Tax=Araneus ventricosus TaxID=182803 RepID=A0A4Y2N111_ARAVE|nr:hypothetical protein AVEN_169751-1 [Araneus ventricosus]